MYALYYDGRLVGVISDETAYPGNIGDALSPDEGLVEMVEIPDRLDRPDPQTIEEIAAIVEDADDQNLLDEHVHDAKGAEAASINNAGISDQAEYLLQTMKPRELKELVQSIIAES